MLSDIQKRKLEVLKKLQTLIKSDPDSPEAQTASQMAAQLMEKYGLSLVDLDAKGSIKNGVEEKWLSSFSKKMGAWETRLFTNICDVFDCYPVLMGAQIGVNETFHIFGTKTDIELCFWFLESLHRKIGKLAEKRYPQKRMQTDFAMGMTESIVRRMKEMKSVQENERTSQTKELVEHKFFQLKNHVQEMYGEVQTVKRSRTISHSGAFAEGKEEGEKLALSVPLNENSPMSDKKMIE